MFKPISPEDILSFIHFTHLTYHLCFSGVSHPCGQTNMLLLQLIQLSPTAYILSVIVQMCSFDLNQVFTPDIYLLVLLLFFKKGI